jgi:hypothetical protein
MVRPGLPAPLQPDALSEVETAAIDSMDGAARAAARTQCQGEPGSSGNIDCWRGVVKKLLASHTEEASGQEMSSFEQRYIRHRLSTKGYAKFQQAMEMPAGSQEKLSLLSGWHDRVLNLDVKEYLAAAAPAAKAAAPETPAPATAPVVPAATPTVTPSTAGVHAAPSEKGTAPAPAGKPKPSTVKTPAKTPASTPAPLQETAPPAVAEARAGARTSGLFGRRFVLGLLLLFIIAYWLFRRKRGKR